MNGYNNPTTTQIAGLPTNYTGVVVSSVQVGSPAEKAGLRGSIQRTDGTTEVGDIIVKVDGHSVKTMKDIINYTHLHKSVGDSLTLTINRNGHIMNIKTSLIARPS